jgi:hypothetical protein
LKFKAEPVIFCNLIYFLDINKKIGAYVLRYEILTIKILINLKARIENRAEKI